MPRGPDRSGAPVVSAAALIRWGWGWIMAWQETKSGAFVLLVEDDLYVREAMALLLECELGLPIVQVADGVQALAVLEAQPASVVLTDLQMPAMDGMQLVRRLRRQPQTRGTPIMVMSGSSQRRQEALRAGADMFVEKPFDYDDLVGKVRCLLRSPRVAAA